MAMKRLMSMLAIIIAAMTIAPVIPASPEDARAADITVHISTFSDGNVAKTVAFSFPNNDRSLSISIPNGARVISATMNVTGLPKVDGGPDYPENITVDVGNDGAIEYAFQGKGYGQMGYQTLFSNGAPYQNVSLPQNGGTNATPSIRLPKNATVTSAVMNISGGGMLKPAGKILLCIADDISVHQALQTRLLTFPDVVQVDMVVASSATPTLATLKQYDSVLVGSNNPFSDPATLGNNLADYVDGGGGVVMDLWSHCGIYALGGRFVSGDYCAISSAATYVSGTQNMGTVHVPGHSILTGVSSLSVKYYITSNSITSGAVRVADFANNCPMLATKSIKGIDRADFGFPMNPSYWSPAVDGLNLIHNALCYVGRGITNCSLDVGNDGSFEYRNTALNTSESIPDVAAQFNSYLTKAQPNGTDAYGNEYVDVPIALSSNLSGTLQLDKLSISYRHTTTVDPNPTSGNLAEGFNAVIPKIYNMKSTNITVAVFSNHTGKVKISNINIDYTPPVHPAIIESRTPEDIVVMMDENSTMEFCITARDPYEYPMNTTWTVNNKVVLKNLFNLSWFADFDANGTYNVTVSVDNELQKVATSWMVIVRNTNRKPVIDSFNPEKKFEMDENTSAVFEVSASDPDGDALAYTWYVDSKRVSTEADPYEYKTTYASAGKHEVKVNIVDALGASTILSWNVTVKEINAVPIIADSSPSVDEVTMTENSTKKFSIIDQSPDGDKQFIQWSLDGNNTGITGRSYNYSADFDAAGSHVLQAEVTDGKLSEKRIWNVVVTDVNRAPRAVISSPAAQAEFLLGSDIVLDGTTSADPDGDPLSMTWSEGTKVLGTGATLTVRLAKGRHLILLGVDDGRKSGAATSQVEIFVRYIDFKAKVSTNVETPTEGRKVAFSAVITNKGDATIGELPVSFRVDGQEVSSTTIEGIEPDSEFTLEFQWKAVKGDHKLEVSVNNQNFSKTITVAKKPAAGAATDSMLPLAAVAIVVVIALAAGAIMFAGRRKRAAHPQAPQQRVAQRPQAAVAYTPARQAARGPSARPPPIPTPTRPPGRAPAIAPHAPAMTEDAKALDAIQNTERMLQEAEKVGLDTAKARQSFKIARNFYEMGKYQRAMLYCKTAEDNIE
jgi:hypothetical protein